MANFSLEYINEFVFRLSFMLFFYFDNLRVLAMIKFTNADPLKL